MACEKYPAEASEYCRMRAGRALMNQRGLRARFGAPPDAAKTPTGKYNYGQVRDIVRKVAMNLSLGKETAVDVLDQDGGGVTSVSSMLPENLDNVYEACQVLLSGEGASSEGKTENMIPIGPHEAVNETSAKALGLLAKQTVQP